MNGKLNKSLMRLDGKVSLITGGAQGIGKSVAKVFAHEGATVVIADVQDEKGQAVAESLDGRGTYIHTDLSKDNDIQEMISATVEKYGVLDVLVNNAAPSRHPDHAHNDLVADWDATMDILLRAYLVGAKCAYAQMKETGGGNIINMGSTLAFSIARQSGAYHVSKAGIAHLTRYLAWEFGPKGVRVNSICPGLIDRDEGHRLTSDPVNREAIKISVPLKKAGSSIDVGYLALFLCTEEAAYITGQSILLDGGMSLGEQFEIARDSYRNATEVFADGRDS